MLAVTVPATSAKTAKDMVIASVPKPVPVKDYLLVKVEAFGINRADTLQRQGGYPAPPGPGSSDIMGLEIAGTVEVAADGFAVGDRVFGWVASSVARKTRSEREIEIPVPYRWSGRQTGSWWCLCR